MIKVLNMIRRPQLAISALAVCLQTTAVMGQATFLPSDLNPGDPYHVAFVTFSGGDALSPDIADYNAFVTTQAEFTGAETENWGVNWYAIASTATVDARDNIPVSTAPVYLLSDVRVADNATDLWDGDIQDLLSVNQNGDFDSSQNVWTGTQSDGTAFLTQQLGTASPRIGFSGVTNSGWVSFGQSGGPSTLRAFYGVSDVLFVPEPSSLGLLLLGLAALYGAGRRQRR
jgi:hypothetical protein